MRKLVLLAIVVALVASGFGSIAGAQAPQLPIIAANQTVALDFPLTITFHLSVDLPDPIDRAELRYTTSGKDFANTATVVFDQTEAVDIIYRVDAQIDYIEPGVEITYYWILGSSGDPVARTADRSVDWVDESLDWQLHESADIQLYIYDNDVEFDQYIIQVAQEAADQFKLEYDTAEIAPMRIWVYANNRDFSRALRQNSESWIGGFSLPQAGVIGVPIAPGDDFSVDRIISHEVSHHVLYQATQNPFMYPPTWLDEGLAVIAQRAGNGNDLQIALGALDEGTLPTLRTLSSSFPSDPAAANRSYATSHMAVQYIIDTWGLDAITELIQQFRQSVTSDQALLAVLGIDTAGLDAQFREWLAQQ